MSEDRKLENEIGEVRDTHRPGAECPNLGGFFPNRFTSLVELAAGRADGRDSHPTIS
jgi:hypothetical protein